MIQLRPIFPNAWRFGIPIGIVLVLLGSCMMVGSSTKTRKQNQVANADTSNQPDQEPRMCSKFLKTKLDERDAGKEYNVAVRKDCIAVVIQWPKSGYALDIDPDLGIELLRYALRPKFGHMPDIDEDLDTGMSKYISQKYCLVGPILPRALSPKSYIYWQPKDVMCITGYDGTVTLKLRKLDS